MKNLIIAFCIIAAAGSISAAKGAGPRSLPDIPVTSALTDAQNGFALRIASDGSGSYPNSASVVSIIDPSGDWILDTNTRTPVRMVTLDFGEPVAGSAPGGATPAAPFLHGLAPTRLIAQAHNYFFSFIGMSPGESKVCNMAVAFTYGGSSYRIAFNTANFPSTDLVNVTCTAGLAGACTNWIAAPIGASSYPATLDPNPKNRGKLLKLGKAGKETDLGDFLFSFNIGINR